MKYPRAEIWFRKAYEELVEKQEITTIFRPGDRICGGSKTKCFYPAEQLTVRVLEKPGDDERNIEPLFTKTVKKVKIVEIKTLNINDLSKEDFVNTFPDVKTPEGLRYHLGLIYDKSPSSFEIVTKIKIKYL